jgi:hypothetical protein
MTGWNAYSTAQVCENGHVVNPDLENYPEKTEPYCSTVLVNVVTEAAKKAMFPAP